MKIIVAGGTGHLGRLVTSWFGARGHEIVVLSRNVEAPGILWDGRTLGPWAQELDGADVVINLAGRSVDCRYDERARAEIMESRVESATVIGEAIRRAKRPPRLWLQMSTATIYSHRFDAPNDEFTGIIGGQESDVLEDWTFSIDVARAWEHALEIADTPKTRKVALRSAMVMAASHGGAFEAFRRHIKIGFGRLGDGHQWVSWIHERDFVRALEFMISHEQISGVVNLAAPTPLPFSDFINTLQHECGESVGVPLGGWMLDAGAFLMRTEPELVLKSRRVVPSRLLMHGFVFDFPQWPEAASDLVARYDRPVAQAVW